MIKQLKNLQLSNPYDLLPHLHLLGYVDSEYAGNIGSKKSTGAYIFMAAGAPIN